MSACFPDRYLLFVTYRYYPSGGLGDLHGTYDAYKDAYDEYQKLIRKNVSDPDYGYYVVTLSDLATLTPNDIEDMSHWLDMNNRL